MKASEEVATKWLNEEKFSLSETSLKARHNCKREHYVREVQYIERNLKLAISVSILY
jgi:hypothetical protein